MSTRRDLSFDTYDEALAELSRLERGYTKLGTWDLAQTCNHLAFFMEGALDGHQYKVPWIFKFLFGRMVLKRVLTNRAMKPGVPTPQKPLPEAGGDQAAAVARLRLAIDRMKKHDGEFHDSPFFGHVTPDEWRELQLIHCAHHLGYLQPNA